MQFISLNRLRSFVTIERRRVPLTIDHSLLMCVGSLWRFLLLFSMTFFFFFFSNILTIESCRHFLEKFLLHQYWVDICRTTFLFWIEALGLNASVLLFKSVRFDLIRSKREFIHSAILVILNIKSLNSHLNISNWIVITFSMTVSWFNPIKTK